MQRDSARAGPSLPQSRGPCSRRLGADRLWQVRGAVGLQSLTAPAVKLISVAVVVRAPSEAAKTATLATSSYVWPELRGQLAAGARERGPCDVGATEAWDGFAAAGHGEDDAGAAWRHVPCGCRGDHELGGDGLGHRTHEVVELHVEHRRALDVVVGRGVEADVDAAGGVCHGGRVPLHRGLVENVERDDVRPPPSRWMRRATSSRAASVRPVRWTRRPRGRTPATAEPIASAPPWTIAVRCSAAWVFLSVGRDRAGGRVRPAAPPPGDQRARTRSRLSKGPPSPRDATRHCPRTPRRSGCAARAAAGHRPAGRHRAGQARS